MGLRIAPATPEQFEAISALCLRAYMPSGLPSDHPYYARLRDTPSRASEAEVWAATEHGRVLGTVTWCPPGSPWREIAADDEGEFRMLAVDPGEQGRGTGRALVKACIERARADGFRALVLSTAGWMTAAHHLYQLTGFVRTPERDWSPAEGIRLQTYRLDLGE